MAKGKTPRRNAGRSSSEQEETKSPQLTPRGDAVWAISRRDFFKVGGSAGVVSTLGTACNPLTVDFETTLVRPDDLLYLRFEFVNLELEPQMEGGQALVRSGFGAAYIIVHFQPQHIFEEALLETNPPAQDQKPVGARIAGDSRVVLTVPSDHPPIPYTGEGLLEALGSLQMNVAATAKPPTQVIGPIGPIIAPLPVTNGSLGGLSAQAASSNTLATRDGKDTLERESGDVRSITSTRDELRLQRYLAASDVAIAPSPEDLQVIPADQLPVRPSLPTSVETALEVPYRLVLSPNRYGGWAHNTSKDQGFKQGRYELWHTRLGVRSSSGVVNEDASFYRKVRAIWSRDIGFQPDDWETYKIYTQNPGAVPAEDVIFGGAPQPMLPEDRIQIVHLSSNSLDLNGYTPRPIDVQRLMLSSMGAWLDSSVDFGINSPANLIGWDHQAAMGRDYYVKVVKKGRLYPWGHLTLRITITERKFLDPYKSTAYLWQYDFLRVIEPHRDYPTNWHAIPFKSVTLKTLVTPKLYNTTNGATRVEVQSGPVRFKMQAIDKGNNLVEFEAPAVWVPVNGAIVDEPDADSGLTKFNDEYAASVRTSSMNGQRIAFGPNGKKDDTTYETTDIQFQAAEYANTAVPFLPSLQETQINVEAIRHLLGQGGATSFEYHPDYKSDGFGGINLGEVLFKIKGGSLNADFAKKSDSSGGFVEPSMSVSGISRKSGLVSGSADTVASSGEFDPADFLPDAFMFGVIPLKDIFKKGGLDTAPKFITKTVDAVTGFLEDANELRQQLIAKAGDLGYNANSLTDQLLAAIDAIGDIPSPTANDFATKLSDAQNAVSQLTTLLGGLINDPLAGTLPIAEKNEFKRKARSIRDVLNAVNAGLKAFATGVDLAKNLSVKLEWRTPLQKDSAEFFVPKNEGGFMVAVEARAKQVGDKPAGVDVVAGIEKFDVNVFGSAAKLVTIPFKHLLFKVESGRKPEVDVMFEGGGVGFDGILAFIEMLSKLIPGAGFSDPPALEVDAEGIRASFSIPIPSIAVGVFAMQNMRLSAGFEVPFIGNPLSVSFGFCSREEPFVMTIMMIGGGGFVGLKLSPRGMLLLEAALEARAQLAVDFGVASGSISIAAGIYFRLEVVGDQEQGSLTGYLRFQGKVDVLGIISASITLLLEMIYEFTSGKLTGRATLTIEVSIAFFSFSVEVVAERKLAGSNDDPTFAEQMGTYKLNEGTPDEITVDPWAEYTAAFVLAA